MDRKHFLKGSEARAGLVAAQLRNSNTPRSYTFYKHKQQRAHAPLVCALFSEIRKSQRRLQRQFGLVIWPHLYVCFQPKGEVSQDMRYPICLIRHLFLNRPHLHSLARSIHKNTDCKRRLALKKKCASVSR